MENIRVYINYSLATSRNNMRKSVWDSTTESSRKCANYFNSYVSDCIKNVWKWRI